MLKLKFPVFMPVGTAASVKSLTPTDLKDIGAEIILANNYHLFLRPGSKAIQKLGGIHEFMHTDLPVLTDSGGFQIMSLSKDNVNLCQIDDDGATFKSHLDGGQLHRFTPEIATRSQLQIGSDIIMAFDCPVPEGADRKTAELCVKRTHEWLERCIKKLNAPKYHPPPPPRLGGGGLQAGGGTPQLFGIIQGGIYKDLLKHSTEFILSQNLPGIAVGGAVVGSNQFQTAETITFVKSLLPKKLPLYAMGVGVKPSDLTSVFKAGADMCDCVAPTRLARTGYLYNREQKSERIDISKTKFRLDKNPIDNSCDCSTCSQFTRAYLHHLFKSRELLYYRLASIHNLRVMLKTALAMRKTPFQSPDA